MTELSDQITWANGETALHPRTRPQLRALLAKAAELQRLVPNAVLVGDAAAALHAGHRQSFDHDHVVPDLVERFDAVLDTLEAVGDWSLARARPGKIILGELGGIETGIRQLIRRRPLEVETVLVDGNPLVVPTKEEILRIKAWLAVNRNQTRDFLDIAALADTIGIARAAAILSLVDDYYADVNPRELAVATQVARQLADPRPRDAATTSQLHHYKGLAPRWHEWSEVCAVLRDVAGAMVEAES